MTSKFAASKEGYIPPETTKKESLPKVEETAEVIIKKSKRLAWIGNRQHEF